MYSIAFLAEKLIAIALSDHFQPIGERAAESETLQVGLLGVGIRKHQVEVDLVDELDAGFAVGVVVVEIGLEKWVALVVEEHARSALILAENGTNDFLVGH